VDILNAPTVIDGDQGWEKFDAKSNPELLQPGTLQRSTNLRLDRGIATVRKGAFRRGDLITGRDVLTLDFNLAPDINVSSIVRSASVATVTVSSPHGMSVGTIVNLRDTGIAAYNGDFFVTSVPSSTSFTFTVTGAPGNVGAVGVMNAGPVLGTGPLEDPIRTAARYVNAAAAGKPEYIILASKFRSYHYREGVVQIPIIEYPAGETVDETDDVSLVQANDRMYLLRSPVEEGLFAPFTVTSITRDGMVATATAVGHYMQVGNRVRIIGTAQAAYNQEFDITSITPDTFTFNVSFDPVTPATPDNSVITAQRVKPPMYWDGVSPVWTVTPGGSNPAGATFSRMPGNSAIAVYFNNQFGIARSNDEWWLSDIFDPDTYDPFTKSFRTGAGGNDYIVAAHVFADRDLLVFCRYSIWRIHIELDSTGTSIDTAASYIAIVTTEVGCRARNSVAMVRNYIYFLSDSGVYRIDPNFTEQRLTEQTLLLSYPIEPILTDLNLDEADKASASFQDNRYWLLIQRNGDGGSANTLLSFFLLNDGWESVDAFTGLDGVQLVKALYNNKERLFCASEGAGVLFLLNEKKDGDDPADSDLPIVEITGTGLARRYICGDSFNPKRFVRFKSLVNLAANGSAAATAFYLNPETTQPLSTTIATTAEDYALKLPLRNRAHAVDMQMALTKPDSEWRNCAVEATTSGQPPDTRSRTQN
jgi:hypothetical protein